MYTTSNKHLYRGFTLAEMLVVVSIIFVLLALAFPMFGQMRRIFEDQTGLNTVQVAVAAARTYATREIPDADHSIIPNANYSGAGVLFTPGRQIRLIENAQYAIDTNGDPVEETNSRNAFQDIDGRDYLTLPRDVGLVGITRETGNANLVYLAPPFAIRFDENGHLVVSDSDVSGVTTPDESEFVYYDANYDKRIRIDDSGTNKEGVDRGESFIAFVSGSYDADRWDPDHAQYADVDPGDLSNPNRPGIDEISHQQRLPFERIECVVGFLVYSKRDFFNDGHDFPLTTAGEDWLKAKGIPVFVSRYTGLLLKGGADQ